MRVLTSRTQCSHCGANLEYNSQDIERDYCGPNIYFYENAIRYITCPVCKHKIYFT